MRLKAPDAILKPSEYEKLRLTVEDFRFVTQEPTGALSELPAEIRARSTILRRLLVARDLFHAGKHFPVNGELLVAGRLLDFNPPHPTVIVSCGNYPWKGDLLPGMAATFSIKGVAPMTERPGWNYIEEASLPLTDYLKGTAIAVLGTSISRHQLIKYIADKKAAHASDKRSHIYERAMDAAWNTLAITIVATDKSQVVLNIAYLETLAIIEALAQSQTIVDYINRLDCWLDSAETEIREGEWEVGNEIPLMPVQPIKR